MIPTW
jgi:hypothetical protein